MRFSFFLRSSFKSEGMNENHRKHVHLHKLKAKFIFTANKSFFPAILANFTLTVVSAIVFVNKTAPDLFYILLRAGSYHAGF